jgi:hypothetical protein
MLRRWDLGAREIRGLLYRRKIAGINPAAAFLWPVPAKEIQEAAPSREQQTAHARGQEERNHTEQVEHIDLAEQQLTRPGQLGGKWRVIIGVEAARRGRQHGR